MKKLLLSIVLLLELLRSQQGELYAVLMYQRLAKVVKTDKEREEFLQLAKNI